MANVFADLVLSMGRPYRWYRMHNATPGSELDQGAPAQLGSPKHITTETGTLTAQQPGPLAQDTTTYSLQFTDGWLDRSLWGSTDFNGTSNGSVTLFFKTGASGTYQFIVGTHPTGAGSLFAFYISDTGHVEFQITSNGSNSRRWSSPSTYNDSSWHMLAMVCDGSADNRMFIDGEEIVPTVTTFGSSPPGAAAWLSAQTTGSASWAFRIGNDTRATASSDLPFVGYLAEIALWEQPLTATEIYDLWAGSQAPPSPPPAGAGGHRYKGRRTFAGF